MSSIPANNLPEGDCRSGNTADSDDPEPSERHDEPAVEIEVDILWDDSVATRRERLAITDGQLTCAARTAAALRGFRRGHLGIRITDDPTIRDINVRHLNHDYATDVISFPYHDHDDTLEGELVASLDTAAEHAQGDRWGAAEELMLYVIHGVLHIAGLDDHDETQRAEMRSSERAVLVQLGLDAERAMEGYGGE